MRAAACELAGVEPSFTIYGGADPDGYALDVNIRRRHMKPGALVLTLEMMRRAEEAETGEKTSKKRFCEENCASHDRLIEAGLVLDYSIDSDLVQDVLSGAKGLQAAAEIARERKAAKKEREAKIVRLKKDGPDLAKLVGDDAMDVDEAIAALELREQKAREEAARAKNEGVESGLGDDEDVRIAPRFLRVQRGQINDRLLIMIELINGSAGIFQPQRLTYILGDEPGLCVSPLSRRRYSTTN